jgi:hypothetical protein
LAGTDHDYVDPIAHRGSLFLSASDRNHALDAECIGPQQCASGELRPDFEQLSPTVA